MNENKKLKKIIKETEITTVDESAKEMTNLINENKKLKKMIKEIKEATIISKNKNKNKK